MFTNNKSAGTSNKNENVLTCDTKAVDVKVERCDDEVQQSEIDLHTYYYNVIKEEMAVGHEVLQHVDKSNCSKETHSESRAETSEQSQNHNESIIKLETEAMSTVREEQIEELYADHEIKDEMVIGPVVLQAFPCMMDDNGESFPKKPSLDTQDKSPETDNTGKQTRTETNTDEIKPNEKTESSDTEPIENVKTKISTKTSKPLNNTQKNIRNDKNNVTTMNVFQCNVCAKQYDKKADLAQHIESHDKPKRDIYLKCKECTHPSVTQCSLERHLKLHDKSRRFVCDVCGYRFMKKAQLQQHLRNVHLDEKIHECGICDYQTNNFHNLNEHLRIHSGEKPYSCSQRDFKCRQKTSLIRHSRIHTGEKCYSCSQCDFKCHQTTNLMTHSRIHTGEKPYSCSECNYKFAESRSLKRHLTTHSEPLPKKPRLDTREKTTEPDNTAKQTRTETNTEEMTPKDCNENTESSDTEPIENVKTKISTKTSEPLNNTQKNIRNIRKVCAKQYDKKPDLVQHIESHDKTKRDIYFKCKECTYQSVTQYSLERHLKLHDKSRRFVCDVCGYRYTYNAHLQQHLRNGHPNEKIYFKCKECTYQSVTQCSLERHLKLHDKSRRFVCDVCGYRYTYNAHLQQHLRNGHPNEKIYFKCKECTYESVTQCSLERHLKLHDKSRHFVCDVCGYRYTDNKHLQQHLRNGHPNEKMYFKCKECTYQSVTQCSLERHLKLHDKSRHFVCDVCGYRYMVNAKLHQHLRIVHPDEKNHECCICDYKTNDILKLTKHIRIHLRYI